MELRTFLSSPSGGSYVAQAGLAYGRQCSRNATHKKLKIVFVASGRTGLGKHVEIPKVVCAVCGTAWPQVEANVTRWEVSGSRGGGIAREEALFLKARLERAWDRIERLGSPETETAYELWILGVSGSWAGLASALGKRLDESGWTEWRARRRVEEARRIFGRALQAASLLERGEAA